ncbi:MAG: GNAT family N-acetyltransferase [Rhizobiaceae bacterium]
MARFVSERIGIGLCPPYTAMGTEREGRIVNGVIFNCYEAADVHVTIAGRSWTKGFLADVGQYVFGTLKRERITVQTEQPKIVRIAERLGGKVEGLKRNHFGPGRDAFIVGILKEDYPW